MRTQRGSHRSLALSALLAAGTSLVWSPAARAGGNMQACYQKDNGQVRISTTGKCRSSEMPLSWGAQGPKGDKGDRGDTGNPGPAGVRALERVDFSSTADSSSEKKAFAKCPTGKKVLSGGAQIFIAGSATLPVALKASFPSDALDGWAATAEAIGTTDATTKWFLTAFAICANGAKDDDGDSHGHHHHRHKKR